MPAAASDLPDLDHANAPLGRWRFGDFVLDEAAGQLRRDGRPIELPPRPFALLVHLVRHAGRLVSKDELLDAVWGTEHITEGVIKTAMSALRLALDEDPRAPRWIETVPRRGYRFVAAAQPEPAAAAAAPARPCCNLPERLPPMIGRDDDLARLLALLQSAPWVTLVGPGGVGKTTLARAAAQALSGRHADGGWFVELAPLAPEGGSALDVCKAIATALHLPEQAAQSVAALAEAVRPLAQLLVLDNAEHLREPVAEVVAALVQHAPRTHILVTSQAVIGLPGEAVLALRPLALPQPTGPDGEADTGHPAPALQLFVQRVAEKMPGFALSHRHAEAAVEVCRLLDGLPLALELAAARVPLLGLHGLAERLRDDAHLPWLRSATRLGPERQRSLSGTVAWSCALLTPPQQRLLALLSVFRGGFTLDAAVILAAEAGEDAHAVPDRLEALRDRSLLLPDDGDGREPPRHRMLEGVREFAGGLLDDQGRRSAAMQGLLAAETAHWRRADQQAHQLPMLHWSTRHQPELNHLRAALAWALGPGADGAGAVRLLGHTGHTWQRLAVQREGMHWFEAALAHLDSVADPPTRARFITALALQSVLGHAPAGALVRDQILWAADTLHQAGDAQAAANAGHAGFHIGVRTGTPALAEAALQRQARDTDPRWSDLAQRPLRWNRAYALRQAGDAAAYERAMRDEVQRCRQHGALAECWIAAQGLMLALLDQDRQAEALAITAPALAEMRAQRLLSRYPAMAALWLLLLATHGDFSALAPALAETAPVLESAGTGFMLLPAAALLAEHAGRPDQAAQLCGHYRHHTAAMGHPGRHPGFVQRVEQGLAQRLMQALGPAAWDAACQAGAALHATDALALALRRG